MRWILTGLQEEIKDLLSKDHGKRLELKERPDTGVYVKASLPWQFGICCPRVLAYRAISVHVANWRTEQ